MVSACLDGYLDFLRNNFWNNIGRRANFAGTKNCDGKKRSNESEGGQKFLPPTPLPFCPPDLSRRSFNAGGA